MKREGMWSLKLSTAALVLIPVAIGINYIGKFFAELLRLPLWLDSIGTALASMLAGPIVGALSGAINNIIYGLTVSPISFVYAITSVAIGLTVGIMAYKGWISNLWKAIVMGLVVGPCGCGCIDADQYRVLGRTNRQCMGRCFICFSAGPQLPRLAGLFSR
jgi:energy-coupling factor transport system substrate-specific component